MKRALIIATYFCIHGVSAQPWFSKTYDPFIEQNESIQDLKTIGDTVIVLSSSSSTITGSFRTAIGKYPLAGNEFYQIKRFEEAQAGKSLLCNGKDLLVSAQSIPQLEHISMNVVDKGLLFNDSIVLSHTDHRYFEYTIRQAIQFGDRYILGAGVLDSLDTYPSNQGTSEKIKVLLFALNKNLGLDTILVVSPTAPPLGRLIRLDDLAVSGDSMLYASFRREYVLNGDNILRREIYGYNKNLEKVFEWSGEDYLYDTGPSSLLVDDHGTIYIDYNRDYHFFVYAINPDGSKKWECQLDTFQNKSIINVYDFCLAKNGDIIGGGNIQGVLYDIGSTGCLFRVSPDGQKKWDRIFRTNHHFSQGTSWAPYGYRSWFSSVIELPDGAIMAGGEMYRFRGLNDPLGTFNQDLWIVRADTNGCIWKDCPYIQDIVTKSPNDYVSLVTPDNEWVIDHVNPGLPKAIRRYTFTADSVLVDNHYYREFIFSNNMAGGPWFKDKRLFRESGGIVYIKRSTNDPERVLYNFNLGVGDTLPPDILNMQGNRTISDVGTTIWADGIPRKTLTVSSTECSGSVVHVEGMGDFWRMFETGYFCSLSGGDNVNDSIRCFSTNGQLLYKRGNVDGCYISGIDESNPGFFSIYPNPVSDNLILSLPESSSTGNYQVVLTNPVGLTILTQNFEGDQTEIDVSQLPTGLVYVQIYEHGKVRAVGKVAVVHQ